MLPRDIQQAVILLADRSDKPVVLNMLGYDRAAVQIGHKPIILAPFERLVALTVSLFEQDLEPAAVLAQLEEPPFIARRVGVLLEVPHIILQRLWQCIYLLSERLPGDHFPNSTLLAAADSNRAFIATGPCSLRAVSTSIYLASQCWAFLRSSSPFFVFHRIT